MNIDGLYWNSRGKYVIADFHAKKQREFHLSDYHKVFHFISTKNTDNKELGK